MILSKYVSIESKRNGNWPEVGTPHSGVKVSIESKRNGNRGARNTCPVREICFNRI